MDNFNGLPERKNIAVDQNTEDKEYQSFDDQYETNKKNYYEEASSLLKAGWRDSTHASPPTMAGSPELEEYALDLDTNKPLPNGTKQTAIHVLNEPVAWGDRGWFVKEGIQPAPGPDYKVIIREAKDGKWVNVE